MLAVGGTEIAFHVEDEVLPFRSTRKLIKGVHQTPVVDGSGLSLPIRTLPGVKRMTKVAVPIVGWLPLSWLYPTGESQTVNVPKFESYFAASDLICGDFLYIGKHAPEDLSGKTVLTIDELNKAIDEFGIVPEVVQLNS